VAGLKARTQASVAVSADGRDWVLLNASPDLRQQINEAPELQPATDKGPRNSPIKAVVLTNGDVDAIAGLLTLREAQPFTVYGSKRVLDVLAANSIFDVLDASLVARKPMTLGRRFAVEGPESPVGIEIEAFPVPGKVALYLEDSKAGAFRHAGRRHCRPESYRGGVGPPFLFRAGLRQARCGDQRPAQGRAASVLRRHALHQ
jgi:pyrroloquinoline quinone biosynthesis protein B